MKVESTKAPAIARAAAILRLLGRSETQLGVQAIARELGLVPSTCLYVLRALADEGLVAFDPVSKLYALDAGVLTLARGWLRRDRFADLVQPVLERLAREFAVTAMGVQIVGASHMVVVATAQGGAGVQISAQVGSRFPALISATGRCLAAFSDLASSEIERGFRKLRWDNPPEFARWLDQVAEVRARGYAVDRGDYIDGVTVLAAPVFDAAGRPRHALVTLGISGAVERTGIATLGAALSANARTITAQLAG